MFTRFGIESTHMVIHVALSLFSFLIQLRLAENEQKHADFKAKLEHERAKLKDFDTAFKEVETAYRKVGGSMLT